MTGVRNRKKQYLKEVKFQLPTNAKRMLRAISMVTGKSQAVIVRDGLLIEMDRICQSKDHAFRTAVDIVVTQLDREQLKEDVLATRAKNKDNDST